MASQPRRLQRCRLERFTSNPPDAPNLLFEAACIGDNEALLTLLQAPAVNVNWEHGTDPNPTGWSKTGYTPLCISARNGHVQCVRELLKAGADKNKSKSDGATPLYISAQKGHVETMRVLLEAGVDRNKAGYQQATPLIRAATLGHTTCVKMLLENGARKDSTMESGATALYRAAQFGHVEIVKALLDEGYRGKNYYSLAVVLGIRTGNMNRPFCGSTTSSQAQRRKRRHHGLFSLHRRAIRIVMELLSLSGIKANTEQADNSLGTPLIIASMKDHADVVSLLLKAGANIDKARDDGQTSLIISSISGHFGTVRILVNAGANTKIRDSQGKTALDYSQEKGHANISAFLRRAISIAENVDEL